MKLEDAIKQRRFADSYHRSLINLMYTANWLQDKQVRLLKPFDILPQHYNVLRIIRGRDPEPVSPGEIKEVLIDKANDLTRLLDKLEKKGLIRRRLCAVNRRKMDVNLTPKGARLLEEAAKVMDSLTDEMKNKISDKEAASLGRLLDKMRD